VASDDYEIANTVDARLGAEASFGLGGASLQVRGGVHSQGPASFRSVADSTAPDAFTGSSRRLLVSGGASIVTRAGWRLDFAATFGGERMVMTAGVGYGSERRGNVSPRVMVDGDHGRPASRSRPTVVPFSGTRKRAPRGRPGPEVKILLSLAQERRQALKEALTAAAGDEPGNPWRIRVTSRIVYSKPTTGEWWLAITLTRPEGEEVTLLVDPDHQSPALVAAAVRAALH
jgi:hypothetical protein